jgi:hypothetical protein
VWLFVSAVGAHAATPRAYVSVNGNDANICNVPTAPCRTYVGAISQVTPGGEVIVLDSGTFGGGTITQSVTINAPAGVVALAATPIIVDPGSGNTVVLRGLTFQSPTPGATIGTAIGLTHQSGTLFLENSVVDGWAIGLHSDVGAQGLFVKSSVFRNHRDRGLWLPPGSTQNVGIEDSFFERNGWGLSLGGGTGRVSNTVLAGNQFGAVVLGGAEFTFQRCEVSGNSSIGLLAYFATLRVSFSTITHNSVGLQNHESTLESFNNNVIRGNTTDTLGTITGVLLQ